MPLSVMSLIIRFRSSYPAGPGVSLPAVGNLIVAAIRSGYNDPFRHFYSDAQEIPLRIISV